MKFKSFNVNITIAEFLFVFLLLFSSIEKIRNEEQFISVEQNHNDNKQMALIVVRKKQ